MEFTPEHYRDAGMDRLREAGVLLRRREYVGCIYLSGVAVECILRAYRKRDDPSFDARHDLLALKRASGVMSFVRPGEQRAFGREIGNVWQLWKNNLRYAEASRLMSHYGGREFGLRQVPKDQRLRRAAESVFDSATYVVNRGVLRWNSKKR